MNVKSGQRLSKTHLGIVIAVCSAIVFGIYPAATRAAYADGANTSFMIILTTWFRALSLALFCLLMRKRLFPTRKDTRSSATGGFFQSLSILGIIGGLTFLPGPLVIIILFTHTLMLLFFLAWRGEIKLDTATILTTVVALAGLSLVLGSGPIEIFTKQMIGDSISLETTGGRHERIVLVERQAMGEA